MSQVIVGESFRKDAIRSIKGTNFVADVIAEPNNPHDPLAQAVYVDGVHVGYISKEYNRYEISHLSVFVGGRNTNNPYVRVNQVEIDYTVDRSLIIQPKAADANHRVDNGKSMTLGGAKGSSLTSKLIKLGIFLGCAAGLVNLFAI